MTLSVSTDDDRFAEKGGSICGRTVNGAIYVTLTSNIYIIQDRKRVWSSKLSTEGIPTRTAPHGDIVLRTPA